MDYELSLTEGARKSLDNAPSQGAKFIRKKLKFYISAPNPLKFAKRLTNDPLGDYRFRVGNWRAKFIIKKQTIYITEIKPRDKAYK